MLKSRSGQRDYFYAFAKDDLSLMKEVAAIPGCAIKPSEIDYAIRLKKHNAIKFIMEKRGVDIEQFMDMVKHEMPEMYDYYSRYFKLQAILDKE